MPPDLNFKLPHTLQQSKSALAITAVLRAALQAVEPGAAVQRFVQRGSDRLQVEGVTYPLNEYERIFILGAGKAGAPMGQALAGLLKERLTAGIIIVKDGYAALPDGFHPALQVVEASHPLPDARGVRATHRMMELAAQAGPRDLVFCLISGGGSALLNAPVDGVSLADMQTLTTQLLGSGASIQEINTLRKHLDQVKGGQLARLAQPAHIVALVLSDVVGSPLDVIASGPCAPDPTTFAEAWEILLRYGLAESAPQAVLAHLEAGKRGQFPETPKPGDPLFERVQQVIVGSNPLAAQAACQQAEALGFHSYLLTTSLEGEASLAGQFLASVARRASETGQPVRRPACIVAGGETTVTLHSTGRGGPGAGGRNQELALSALAGLDGLADALLVTLATDGSDGLTDAAGAAASGQSLDRAARLGLNPREYLERHDSYSFFASLGDLLITGPTQTNVNDLAFIFLS